MDVVDEIEDFKPFVTQGSVSLEGVDKPVPITILRDTGAKQSLMCAGVLPFSAQSYSGSDIIAWGVELSAVLAPLHFIQLTSRIVSGKLKIAFTMAHLLLFFPA